MADEIESVDEIEEDADAVRETDIVFDCPFCSKSLAIDYRGAGLNIECTDCGAEVVVPIPEGMEISDLDSSPEEQEIRILNLRKALADSQVRVSELEERVDQLVLTRQEFEEDQATAREMVQTVREKVDQLRSLHADIYRALDEIAELVK